MKQKYFVFSIYKIILIHLYPLVQLKHLKSVCTSMHTIRFSAHKSDYK